jgi:hypothetical protein
MYKSYNDVVQTIHTQKLHRSTLMCMTDGKIVQQSCCRYPMKNMAPLRMIWLYSDG